MPATRRTPRGTSSMRTLPRLIELNPSSSNTRFCSGELCPKRRELALSEREAGLRILERGLLLAKGRGGLLLHLYGARLLLGEIPVSRRLLFRKGQRACALST